MIDFRAVAAGPVVNPSPVFSDTPPVLIGMSAAMERLRGEILRVAAESAPVLVSGEAGTGKSLVARALHEMGPRAKQLCAVVACHAFPETLLEIELFGCVKGSVVGATTDRVGVLEMVDGGTVILENIEAVSPRTQSLLERFFATGRVQPVGTLDPGNSVHACVVAVTSVDPSEGGTAPRDAELWSRLRANHVQLPPLRERPSDVPLLSQFFSAAGDGHGHGVVFSAEALRALRAYSWPGNVAQLKSVVERLTAHAQAGQVRQGDLPVGIRPKRSDALPPVDLRTKLADDLFARLQTSGDTFWSSVYPLFMAREMTRADLRALIRLGMNAAQGRPDAMLDALKVPAADAKRFWKLLRRFDCDGEAEAVSGHRLGSAVELVDRSRSKD